MRDHCRATHTLKLIRCVCLVAAAATLTACGTTPERSSEESSAANTNVELALGNLRQGREQLALQHIRTALAEAPELPSAYHVAALINERLGRNAEAEQYFDRARKLAPNDASVLNNYGKFLCNRGRLQAADEQFLAAAKNEANPSPEVAYANAGLCARRIPDLERATGYFHAALEANPKMPTALYQLARIDYEQQRYPRARAELERYLKLADHTPETLALGVRIERALGEPARAERYARLLRQRFPDSEEASALAAGPGQPVPANASPAEPATDAPQGADIPQASTPPEEPDPPVPADQPGRQGTAAALLGNDSDSGQPPAGKLATESWVLARDPKRYTIQLLASQDERALRSIGERYSLPREMAYFAQDRDGEPWYSLVYGNFADEDAARRAVSQLPQALQDKTPWVRRFADIQQTVRARSGG